MDILLVEDNQADADLIVEFLADASDIHPNVTNAMRLADAVEATERHSFDVILLDLALPDSDGLETVDKMARAVPDTPVVVLTGRSDGEPALASLSAGAQDYIVKGSVDGPTLSRIMRYAIERKRADLRIRRSERFLNATLDALKQSVALLELDGRIVRVNRSWWGFGKKNDVDPDKIKPGVNYLDACRADRGELTAGIRDVLSGRRAHFALDYPCHSPVNERWFECKASRFEVGEQTYVVVLHEEITDRKLAEAALLQKHEELLETQRLAHLGGWELQLPSRSLAWTDETYRIFGISQEDFHGTYEHFVQFIHPEDREKAVDAQAKARAGEKELFIEYRILRPDGEIRHVHEQAELQYDTGGQPSALRGIVLDVTELKGAIEKLYEVSSRFQAFVEYSPLLISEISLEGTYVLANQEFCEAMGRAQRDIVGKNFNAIWEGPIAELFFSRIREVVSAGEPIHVEDRLQIGGDERWYETWLFPLHHEDGSVRSVGSIARETTAEKRAEQDKQKLEEQLLQSQKMEAVGRLAGGVAHDYNNMLGVILGYGEILQIELGESHPLAEEVNSIIDAGNRSVELTRQLLAFARQQTISPESMNLNDVVPEMLKMLGRLAGENIRVHWHPQTGLWPVMLDPVQVDQILANLAVNARDAIPDVGTITIETENITLDDAYARENLGFVPGEYVLLTFSDSGSGIPKDIQERIFEPFFTTKAPGEGTGLGLSTIHGIVHQNGGLIHVYSEVGEGTTFRMYFPRVAKSERRYSEEGASREIPKGSEIILLVEDEPSLLELGVRQLTSLGYSVLSASTPMEAIDVSQACPEKIDLLVTDVIMPQMNGRALFEELCKDRPDLSVLYMSGYTANVIAHHGVLKKGVNFISKPFSYEKFAHRVREVLDGRHP